MKTSFNIKNLYYDENNNLVVATEEDKVMKFTNPYIKSANLGGNSKPITNNDITFTFNGDDK